MKDNITLLQNHMEMLCEKIGPRPTGSEENRAAVDYAFSVLQGCGLDVRKQEFACIDWTNGGASLMIDGQNIMAQPAEYSLKCSIDAEFTCINTIEALQKAEMAGKIAVLHGDLCKEPLMPKNFEFYNPDEHKQIIALLEEKNPAAIITVSPQNDTFINIIQDGDFNIPCAVVCGNTLNKFLGSPGKNAKLSINAERTPAKSHNIIAAYGKGKEKICFSAHIDTKPATPGALDNASGVSVLLALAKSLANKDYPFQVEIVLLNGEDYYSIPGELSFMATLTPEYALAVNVDGIGLKNSSTSVSFYECPPEIEKRVMEYAKTKTWIERIEPWPMGDHMIFAMAGIPTIAVTASNIFNLIDTVIHTPDDGIKNIDFNILNNIMNFLLNCIE